MLLTTLTLKLRLFVKLNIYDKRIPPVLIITPNLLPW